MKWLLIFCAWITAHAYEATFSDQEIHYINKNRLIWRVEFIEPPSLKVHKEEYPMINGKYYTAYNRLVELRSNNAVIIYCALEPIDAASTIPLCHSLSNKSEKAAE